MCFQILQLYTPQCLFCYWWLRLPDPLLGAQIGCAWVLSTLCQKDSPDLHAVLGFMLGRANYHSPLVDSGFRSVSHYGAAREHVPGVLRWQWGIISGTCGPPVALGVPRWRHMTRFLARQDGA